MLGFDDPIARREYWLVQLLHEGMNAAPETVRMIRATRPFDELVALLHSENAERRRVATAMLWTLWMGEAGKRAEQHILRGLALLEQQRFTEAEALFSDLILAHPDFAEAYNKRATTRYLMGEYELAAADCAETLTRNQCHFGAWHGLGLCREALGEFEAAAQAYAQALALQPYAHENRKRLRACQARAEGWDDD